MGEFSYEGKFQMGSFPRGGGGISEEELSRREIYGGEIFFSFGCEFYGENPFEGNFPPVVEPRTNQIVFHVQSIVFTYFKVHLTLVHKAFS